MRKLVTKIDNIDHMVEHLSNEVAEIASVVANGGNGCPTAVEIEAFKEQVKKVVDELREDTNNEYHELSDRCDALDIECQILRSKLDAELERPMATRKIQFEVSCGVTLGNLIEQFPESVQIKKLISDMGTDVWRVTIEVPMYRSKPWSLHGCNSSS